MNCINLIEFFIKCLLPYGVHVILYYQIYKKNMLINNNIKLGTHISLSLK